MSDYTFLGLPRDLALSVIMGHAIEIKETSEGPGCWMVKRRELVLLDGNPAILRTVEWIGGESDDDNRYFADESIVGRFFEGILSAIHYGNPPAMAEYPPGKN